MKNRFRKDYHSKTYKNPFFQNRRKDKKPKQSRLRISSCFLIFILTTWFIFLFFSPFFRIENVNFGNTDKDLQRKIKLLIEAEFEKRILILFSRQNYFVFNVNNLSNQLNTMFLLNELEIKKKFPNTLSIEAKEKNDVLALITADNAFFVDKQGLIVDIVPESFKTYSLDTVGNATTTIDGIEVNPAKIELSDEITRKLPVVSIENIEKASMRDKVLDEELISIILSVYQNLLSKLGVSLELFKICDTEDRKMTVITKDGWEVYFTLNGSIDEQLENLKVILLEKVDNDRYLLDYIDLRFGDKIYFKFIE